MSVPINGLKLLFVCLFFVVVVIIVIIVVVIIGGGGGGGGCVLFKNESGMHMCNVGLGRGGGQLPSCPNIVST